MADCMVVAEKDILCLVGLIGCRAKCLNAATRMHRTISTRLASNCPSYRDTARPVNHFVPEFKSSLHENQAPQYATRRIFGCGLQAQGPSRWLRANPLLY